MRKDAERARNEPVLHNFGAMQLPLESTLSKVYQNKRLYLPLE